MVSDSWHLEAIITSSREGVGDSARRWVQRRALAVTVKLAPRMTRARRLLLGIGAGLCAGGAYVANTDVYQGPIGRFIRSLDAERAHRLAIDLARWRVAAPYLHRFAPLDDPLLRTTVWGLRFSNPIGLAAGFDKDAEAMYGLFAIGFGFVEVGSVTPEPQPGNEKPRVFRLSEDHAIINRYGFNSCGVEKVRERLSAYDSGGRNSDFVGILGVNIGRNKNTSDENAVSDYLLGLSQLGDLAEYVVINVSSPNTPGLRALQGKQQLRHLLQALIEERNQLMYRPPILLKIAPDLEWQDKVDIAEVATELQVDGLIVSNTTIRRDGLKSEHAKEPGGLSGKPLEALSTGLVSDMYSLTKGKIPIVGVGGVCDGQTAYAKIRAGASLVQVYTALVYDGPWLVPRIKQELAELLRKDGYSSIQEAVGADHRRSSAT